MIKNLIICADDYSQNNDICEGILLLAKNKKINAISCMASTANWHETHLALNPFKDKIYLGLHLNLTLGKALSSKWKETYSLNFNNLPTLIKQCYLGRLDKECVEAEIHTQIDAFRDAMGINPDFIDGHQHIHQLPIIREALLSVYKQKKLSAFFRKTCSDWSDLLAYANFPKRQAITLLGGLAFKRLLRQDAILTNTSFAGIYNFVNAKNYGYYFKQFLKSSMTGGLIMCHPGMESADPSDPLYQYRHFELNYFMSTAFQKDLKSEQCQLIQKP